MPMKSRSVAPNDDDLDQVLTFRQWCALNTLSIRTGRRILASGAGPVITKLSSHRVGITRRNNRSWQASRQRAT